MKRRHRAPIGAGAGRDVPGALGGSRILAHPAVAREVDAVSAAVEAASSALLEVGFDHGRRLSSTAALNPGWTVVGVEVRARRVQQARARAEAAGLDNLFAYRLDGAALLGSGRLTASLDVIEVLFPTPWPAGKKRRRLLVTEAFLADVASALKPGGLLLVATDVDWYAALIQGALDATGRLERCPPDAASALRPACDQQSRREWACERDGIPVHRFAARRRGGE